MSAKWYNAYIIMFFSDLKYPLEAGIVYGPGRDLAQEADLAAQVVVEVGQASVVAVVHPGFNMRMISPFLSLKYNVG